MYIYIQESNFMKIRPETEPSCSTRTHIQADRNDKVNPYPANVENMARLLIMLANGRWDLPRRLKAPPEILGTRPRMRRTASIKESEEEMGSFSGCEFLLY